MANEKALTEYIAEVQRLLRSMRTQAAERRDSHKELAKNHRVSEAGCYAYADAMNWTVSSIDDILAIRP
jgi:hypothetical protein